MTIKAIEAARRGSKVRGNEVSNLPNFKAARQLIKNRFAVPHWEPLATDDDHTPATRFILDNNIDAWILDRLQGLGVSVVLLPLSFRNAPDETVLAEAKRQDRVLITHDQRFVNPRDVEPEKNPGIIVIPSDGRGGFYWEIVSAVLSHAYLSRDGLDQTVMHVYPSGRITLWNPNQHTGIMERIFCRLSNDRVVEVWVDDDGEWASDPNYDDVG